MKGKDIRWIQRFDNYKKALSKLKDAVGIANSRALSELEKQGLIQAFEFTHELSWKTLKDFLLEKGNEEIYGSRDATRAAFKLEIIDEGEVWMDMIKSRNKSSHTYSEETANEIVTAILETYISEFIALELKLNLLKNNSCDSD